MHYNHIKHISTSQRSTDSFFSCFVLFQLNSYILNVIFHQNICSPDALTHGELSCRRKRHILSLN